MCGRLWFGVCYMAVLTVCAALYALVRSRTRAKYIALAFRHTMPHQRRRHRWPVPHLATPTPSRVICIARPRAVWTTVRWRADDSGK